MYLRELLEKASLQVEEPTETQVVLLPRGIHPWVEHNLVVERQEWEAIYVASKAAEPDVEAVFTALLDKKNREFCRTFANTDSVKRQYMKLTSELEDASAEIPATSSVEELPVEATAPALVDIPAPIEATAPAPVDISASIPELASAQEEAPVELPQTTGFADMPALSVEEAMASVDEGGAVPINSPFDDLPSPDTAVASAMSAEYLQPSAGASFAEIPVQEIPVEQVIPSAAPAEVPEEEPTGLVVQNREIPLGVDDPLAGHEEDLPMIGGFTQGANGGVPSTGLDNGFGGDAFFEQMPVPESVPGYGQEVIDPAVEAPKDEPELPMFGGFGTGWQQSAEEAPTQSAEAKQVEEASVQFAPVGYDNPLTGDMGGFQTEPSSDVFGAPTMPVPAQDEIPAPAEIHAPAQIPVPIPAPFSTPVEEPVSAPAPVLIHVEEPATVSAPAEELTAISDTEEELARKAYWDEREQACVSYVVALDSRMPLPDSVHDWAAGCLKQYELMERDYRSVFASATLDQILAANNITAAQLFEQVCGLAYWPDDFRNANSVPNAIEEFLYFMRKAFQQALWCCCYEDRERAVKMASLFANLIYEE